MTARERTHDHASDHVHAADHVHDHAHDHTHGADCVHHAAAAAVRRGDEPALVRRLLLALVLTAVFFVAEVVGGIVSNSLALLADASHMLTDVGALGLAAGVAWWARRGRASSDDGARRAAHDARVVRVEAKAALVNGAVLLLVTVGIVVEAFERLGAPERVEHGVMLGVAVTGLLVNVVAALLLRPVAGSNLNARGAYLHVLGDLLGSVGTIVAAELVRREGWYAADTAASLVVAVLVAWAAIGLMRDALRTLRLTVAAETREAAA